MRALKFFLKRSYQFSSVDRDIYGHLLRNLAVLVGRRTEFIPFAPRRSHFWLDRDGMQERAKRNEFRSTTKIVARS